MGGLRGPREEFGRRVNTDDLTHGLGVERKVQARADPDLQHTSMQPGGGAAPVGKKLILAHRQMRQPREDMFLVQSHLFTRSAQGQEGVQQPVGQCAQPPGHHRQTHQVLISTRN